MKWLIPFTLLIIVSFTACSQNSIVYKRLFTETHGLRPSTTNDTMIFYKVLADKAVGQIFAKNKVPNRLIVTDFVDLTSLENHSRLGYVLSNNIKDSLVNLYGAKVIEAEVSKYFKISGNGLKILSRDIDNIKKKNLDVMQAIVGTYTYTKRELIVFIKLINLKTGIIEGSYTKTLPMGVSTHMMLKNK